MIYTVTFNPSLDYVVTVNDFKLGMTNRTSAEKLYPGGKGVNVSILLKNIGIKSTALGFLAGFTGDEIDRQLRALDIDTDFIKLSEGYSRINFKLQNVEGTEINGMGPVISEDNIQKLFDKLDSLERGDVLVLAGSIPSSMPSDMYERICEKLKEREVLTVVDATRDLLLNVLPHHPFLIKPNNHELGEIFGVELNSREDVVPYAKKLQEKGAVNVLVSMAGQGAVLVSENGEVYKAEAPKGQLINGVGAGDSMVAGFIAGWLGSLDYEEAFRMGVASGSASAFSEYLAEKSVIDEVYKNVNIL